MDIKKVAVIGTGVMGRQMAMQVAISGYTTTCYSRKQETVDSAAAFSKDWFEKRVAKGKMSAEDAAEAQARLTFTTDIQVAAENADFVLEAVADELAVKRKVLAQLDAITPDHCIYGSNSSYIVASKFADAVKDPCKVLNVHFFNPVLVMKVVELVRAPHVSKETFDTAFEFIKSIGKTPVTIEKEIYGFVVNRIYSALTREACYLVDMGIATPQDIDTAVKGALGHAMGPLETLDMTGIDLEYTVYMEKFRTSGKKEDLPAACITEHYGKGEYGRKNGKGFYEYNK